MRIKTAWIAAAALAFSATAAGAIEISLEQNRAERSSIGFVDMRRLFQAFPETARAKESFQEVVENTEEQMDQKKAEILRLQNKISDLQAQRQTLLQSQSVAPPPQAAAAVPPPQLAALPAPRPVAVSSAAAAVLAVRPSTPTASVFPALPGVPSEKIAPAAPPSQAIPITAPSAPPLVSSKTVQAQAPALAVSQMPSVAQLSASSRQSLAALDSQIAALDQELRGDQAEFAASEAAAEKNLMDLEGSKTDVLLGQINAAIKIVADQEGISVVVDKGNILYGHSAVDLTDKVLRQLEVMR